MGQLRKQDKSDRHELIECPACKTKFAIESHIVAAYETPRFHCSRCDHLFERERRPEPALVAKHDINDINEYIGSDAAPRPLVSEEGEVFPSARSPRPSTSSGLEMPRMFDPALPPSAPQEPAAVSDFAVPESSSEQLELDFAAAAAKATKDLSGSQPSSSSSAPRKIDPPKPAEPREDYLLPELDLGEPEPSIFERAAGWFARPRAAGSGGLAYIVSPLMVFFVGLLGFSYYCQTNPAAAIELSTRLLPGAPSIAPAGVHMKRTRFRKVTLDSGETVGIISGTIVNGSERTIRDILIEGILFGADGDRATTVKVMLGSDLSKTRLRSLNIEMIEQIQDGRGARRIELGTGREADFTIAFPDADVSSADYFAARIYSVR